MNNSFLRFFALFFVLYVIFRSPEQAGAAAENFGAFLLKFLEGLSVFVERLLSGASGQSNAG